MSGVPGGVSPYLIAIIGVVLVLLARRSRLVGTVLTIGLLGLAVMIFTQRAAIDPALDRVARMFGADRGGQQVMGKEMRVPMARDGHFWVRARVGGSERRMLVDSGATVTALSSDTAAALGLRVETPLFPVVLQTANGSIEAQTATITELHIGNIVARDLPVVVSPAFGDMNVIGMNFLSRLKSWRVEGRTLILEPHHPQRVG
ncbi:MAG: TIGR02281 family clan AA aspartic protease [Pseudomonadota bacterium]|uniref:retropepsin-like aspartic protease family protein n=1 Tax=Sphingomonas sp. ERG5 TaxID=1381597 RepID=UPI00054C0982|nr:TIGR02281 family clan AA aspartic protease [Sphingomonas sp. ERG5]